MKTPAVVRLLVLRPHTCVACSPFLPPRDDYLANGMLSSRRQNRSSAEGGSEGLVSRNAIYGVSIDGVVKRGGWGAGRIQYTLLNTEISSIYYCAAAMSSTVRQQSHLFVRHERHLLY